MTLPVVAIVGATATGKSELALAICERLGGEVVNADAMQLYRGMDIGTAKLPMVGRRGIPHHQLDVLEVTDEASVAAYQTAARVDIDRIRSQGALPVLVGGSGLYVRAALDVLDIPPTDALVRDALEVEAQRLGAEAMHERLAEADPVAAGQILATNRRRVVRALEVITLTGRPFSASLPQREFARATVMLGLRLERSLLDLRIDERVRTMFERGLVAEAEALNGRGLRDGFTARRAIGYRQALAVVDATMDEADAVHETARATRRYARRQLSWFGSDQRTTWIDATSPRLLDDAIAVIVGARIGAARTEG